jgi:hypothetical protein
VSRLLRILQLRALWPILLLLAALVIFFEFIADAGGSAEPLPSPPQAVPAASPTPGGQPGLDRSDTPNLTPVPSPSLPRQ